jgi:hypothetical protein
MDDRAGSILYCDGRRVLRAVGDALSGGQVRRRVDLQVGVGVQAGGYRHDASTSLGYSDFHSITIRTALAQLQYFAGRAVTSASS